MLVTFVGDPRGRDVKRNKGFKASDPDTITLFGQDFPLNRPVTVGDKWWSQHGGKISGNGHFEFEKDAPAEKTVSADEALADQRRREAAKAEAAAAAQAAVDEAAREAAEQAAAEQAERDRAARNRPVQAPDIENPAAPVEPAAEGGADSAKGFSDSDFQ